MTFPTGVIDIRKCSDEELKTMLDEAREASKHSRRLEKVMGIVAVHRLKNVRGFLAYQELATWRRLNGFDRIVEDEESCSDGHRSHPPTPQEYYAGFWSEVNALKDAISIPRQKASNLINAIEQSKVSDEEFAILKRLVEKRDREAVQVTVTQVNTVQHSSHCPLDPEPSPDVCVNLENNEGRMDPELEEELESASAGTGLETPGQQGPPNEGTWEQRLTTANGFLTAGVDSSRRGRTPSPPERSTSTRTFADIFSTAAIQENRRRKTPSQQNKQFDPGGRKEKAPPWKAAVTLPYFLGESWKAPCLLSVCASCSVCVCFPNYFFSSQVMTS